MKKLLLIGLFLTAGLLVIGCGDDDDDTSEAGSGGDGGSDTSTGGTKGETGGKGGATTVGTGGTKAGTGGVAAGAGGKAGSDAGSAALKDIVETAVAAGSFKSLADSLTKAGLVDALKGTGPFTVFAPNDDAFKAFETANPGVLAGLSKDALANILKYHVISGTAAKSTDLKNGALVTTLAGPVVAVDLSGSKPKINDATVTSADILATNGVIHVIDKIIVPPGDIIEVATKAGTFKSLADALTSAGLVDSLKGTGPFTVFAPTDDAFKALTTAPTGDALKTVLLYHVVSGIVGPTDLKNGGVAMTLAKSPILFDLSSGAKVNTAKITTTNVVAKNGVIHVIDAVIVPPEKDIVDTAIAAGTFTKLADALTSAGLVTNLKAEGPFTVFAPTDTAFGALASVPTGDDLKNVLLYHVVNSAVGSGDLKAGTVDTLLSGKKVTIDLASGVKVNDAKVSTPNILAKNGVIHVIDKVLVPN